MQSSEYHTTILISVKQEEQSREDNSVEQDILGALPLGETTPQIY